MFLISFSFVPSCSRYREKGELSLRIRVKAEGPYWEDAHWLPGGWSSARWTPLPRVYTAEGSGESTYEPVKAGMAIVTLRKFEEKI